MKNTINYFYGIAINDFVKREDNFTFYIDKNKFEFVKFYGDKNFILSVCSYLSDYRRQYDEIILNKNNDIITYFENVPYILLKKTIIKNNVLLLEDVINYNCDVYIKGNIEWKKLWINKLDYYEMQVKEIEKKYPFLAQSFNYYMGLSEIAINLLNYIDYKNISYCISHKRLEKKEDLYNPLNIIVDNKSRDLAESIKTKFFQNKMRIDEVYILFSNINFTKDEALLFLARLIYPSYYFDLYEKIYNNRENEKKIDKIIKKNAEFEAFLKNVYECVKRLYIIPQIEFLEY